MNDTSISEFTYSYKRDSMSHYEISNIPTITTKTIDFKFTMHIPFKA